MTTNAPNLRARWGDTWREGHSVWRDGLRLVFWAGETEALLFSDATADADEVDVNDIPHDENEWCDVDDPCEWCRARADAAVDL